MSGVCLVLTGPTLDDCRRQLQESDDHIDLAEVRADLLERAEWAGLNAFSLSAGIPLILTLRQPRDGGKWSGSEGERRAFFKVALEGAWSWLDLEDDQRLPDLEEVWLSRGRQLVISFHDFDGVPDGWAARLQAAQGQGLVAKAAVFPKNSADFLQFLFMFDKRHQSHTMLLSQNFQVVKHSGSSAMKP